MTGVVVTEADRDSWSSAARSPRWRQDSIGGGASYPWIKTTASRLTPGAPSPSLLRPTPRNPL